MAATAEPPSRYRVRGLNPAQRAKWDILSCRQVVNGRYPSDAEMEQLGIRALNKKYLTFDSLFHMEVVKTDYNLHAYCPQKKTGDHFPLPSPALTKVDTWENQVNWQMNTPAHHRVVATFPAALPWQIKTPQGGPFLDPGDWASTSGAGQMEDDEEDDDDENENVEEGAPADGVQRGVQAGGSHQIPQLDFQQFTTGRRRARQELPIPANLTEQQRWDLQVQWHQQNSAHQRSVNTQLLAMQGYMNQQNTNLQAMYTQMQQQGITLTEMMQMMSMNPNYHRPPPQ